MQASKISVLSPPDPFASTWLQITEAVKTHQRFLVASHLGPDGDAAGSALGLLAILRSLGKEAFVLNDLPYPERYTFLPLAETVITSLSPEDHFDVTFLCDCGEVERSPLGALTTAEQRGLFIVIDHHKTSGCQGQINLNDPSSPATGLLIYLLAKHLGIPITEEIAKNVYTAIVTDTGSFRYQKTTPLTFRVAAELLEAGVEPWEITSEVFESDPAERQRLLALVLDTLDISDDGQLAFLHATQEMFAKTQTEPDMTDGFVNFARGVKGVEVACLLKQTKDGTIWRGSFRSRGKIDVSAIATQFQGGGHPQAAGATFQGALDEVKAKIKQAFRLSLTPTPPPPQVESSP